MPDADAHAADAHAADAHAAPAVPAALPWWLGQGWWPQEEGQRLASLSDSVKSMQQSLALLERQNGQPSFGLTLAQADIKVLQNNVHALTKHMGVPPRGRIRTTLDADEHEQFDQALAAGAEYEAAGEPDQPDEAIEVEEGETPVTAGTGGRAAARIAAAAAKAAKRRSSGEGARRTSGEGTGAAARTGTGKRQKAPA